MVINKATVLYCLKKYFEVRTSDRGLLFKKRKKDRVNPATINDVIDYYNFGHVQGFFVDKDDILFVFLIGSNELKDWIFNFWFRLKRVPYKKKGTNPKIKVHRGFYHSYVHRVRGEIAMHLHGHSRICVVGQSFGAALATLAAIDIKYNIPGINIGCLVTGSPRVGNRFFVDSYNRRVPDTLRYVNGNDIIAGLPPRWAYFRHVSNEIHIGPKKRRRPSIRDHMIGEYIEGVSNQHE